MALSTRSRLAPSDAPSGDDPYAVLGLPRERLEDLLALGALRGEEAEVRLAARVAAVNEAELLRLESPAPTLVEIS